MFVYYVPSLSPCGCPKKLFSFFFFLSSIATPLEISDARLQRLGDKFCSVLNLGIIPLASHSYWCEEEENVAFCTVVNRGEIESL